MLNMLCDSERTKCINTDIQTAKENVQKHKIVSSLNLFLQRTEKNSLGSGLRLDFSMGENGITHTGSIRRLD